jgi:hypothetical protein
MVLRHDDESYRLVATPAPAPADPGVFGFRNTDSSMSRLFQGGRERR